MGAKVYARKEVEVYIRGYLLHNLYTSLTLLPTYRTSSQFTYYTSQSTLSICLSQPFVPLHLHVHHASVFMAVQNNILILLFQEHVLQAPNSCLPLLLLSLLIIGPLKMRLYGIRDLLRGVVRRFLLLLNDTRSGGG